MKPLNINQLELSAEIINILKHWQNNDNEILTNILETLNNLATFLCDVSLTIEKENDAKDFICFVCVFRSKLKNSKIEA